MWNKLFCDQSHSRNYYDVCWENFWILHWSLYWILYTLPMDRFPHGRFVPFFWPAVRISSPWTTWPVTTDPAVGRFAPASALREPLPGFTFTDINKFEPETSGSDVRWLNAHARYREWTKITNVLLYEASNPSLSNFTDTIGWYKGWPKHVPTSHDVHVLGLWLSPRRRMGRRELKTRQYQKLCWNYLH